MSSWLLSQIADQLRREAIDMTPIPDGEGGVLLRWIELPDPEEMQRRVDVFNRTSGGTHVEIEAYNPTDGTMELRVRPARAVDKIDLPTLPESCDA